MHTCIYVQHHMGLSSNPAGFQSVAEQLVVKTFSELYFRESRIRAQCAQWEFKVLPGLLERRILKRMRIIMDRCPPRVWSVFFRTLWNGWATHERMKQLVCQRPCLLGCGWDEDSLKHYCCCNVYWDFLRAHRINGNRRFGQQHSRETALLVAPNIDEDDVVHLGVGLYALYRTVNTLRFSVNSMDSHPSTMLRMFAKRALD